MAIGTALAIAGLTAGASIIGGFMGSSASKKASRQKADAARYSANIQQQMFREGQAQDWRSFQIQRADSGAYFNQGRDDSAAYYGAARGDSAAYYGAARQDAASLYNIQREQMAPYYTGGTSAFNELIDLYGLESGGVLPGGELPGFSLPGFSLPGGEIPGESAETGGAPGGGLPGMSADGKTITMDTRPTGGALTPKGYDPETGLTTINIPGGGAPGGEQTGGVPAIDIPGIDIPGVDIPGVDIPDVTVESRGDPQVLQDEARDRFTTSPGYEFRRDQGIQGVERSNVGTRLSGGAMKEVARYSEGLASGEFNNYVAILGQLAGIGQSAAGSGMAPVMPPGAATGGAAYGSATAPPQFTGNAVRAGYGIGQSITGAGAAEAEGTMGANYAWQKTIEGVGKAASYGAGGGQAKPWINPDLVRY